jgi:NADP-reducing hydrogenase subunit HndB
MPRIKVEDLDTIEERVRKSTFLSEGAARAKVTVHMGTCGIAAGAKQIMKALAEEFEKRNIRDVILTTSGCAGLCSREPMCTVELSEEAPVQYVELTPDKMRRILQEHVLSGKIVREYALARGCERVY